MDREYFKVDPKKLKEEDRRFLLSKNSGEFLFNEQMMLNNRIFAISIFAVFVSIATLIIASSYNSSNQKIFVITVLCLLSIYLIYLLVRSTINIKRQQRQIQYSYDELFKLHFAYVTKAKK